MARPSKHSKTGVYYLRKRVPRDLVALVGAAFVKESLGTKDPEKAKVEHRARETRLEARWAELRNGGRYLDDEQVEAIAGEIYAEHLARFGKVRSFGAANVHWWHLARNAEAVDGTAIPAASAAQRDNALKFADAFIDPILAAKPLVVDADTRRRLQFAVHRALKQAAKLYMKQVDGDWRPDPDADRFPAFVPPSEQAPATQPVGGAGGLDADAFWAKVSVGYSPGTIKRWRPILDRLVASSGESDLTRVTKSQVEAWRDAALARGEVSPRSFKQNDLAAIKTMFGLAASLGEIPEDPAASVKVHEARKSSAKQMRGFHQEEAATILKATLETPPKRLSRHLAAARRWVPWICAYTGARVNEITQTRASDVRRIDGVWCIHITPEAGTQKSNLKRVVPLHEHLIEQGLVDYARNVGGDRRLFAAEESGGATPSAQITGGKLATWVRKLGISDLDVFPNHGWRHKFKTDARPLMQEMYIDAIQGHAPRTQGRKYGEFPVKQLAVEIAKMPRQEIGSAPVGKASNVPAAPPSKRARRQTAGGPHLDSETTG